MYLYLSYLYIRGDDDILHKRLMKIGRFSKKIHSNNINQPQKCLSFRMWNSKRLLYDAFCRALCKTAAAYLYITTGAFIQIVPLFRVYIQCPFIEKCKHRINVHIVSCNEVTKKSQWTSLHSHKNKYILFIKTLNFNLLQLKI